MTDRAKTEADPIHVIVATEQNSGDEALYVGGDLVACEGTIYACDIHAKVGDSAIQFSHVSVDWPGDWPQLFDGLMSKIVTETTPVKAVT